MTKITGRLDGLRYGDVRFIATGAETRDGAIHPPGSYIARTSATGLLNITVPETGRALYCVEYRTQGGESWELLSDRIAVAGETADIADLLMAAHLAEETGARMVQALTDAEYQRRRAEGLLTDGLYMIVAAAR